MAVTVQDVRRLFATVSGRYNLGVAVLKPEQEQSILSILSGQNTFCIYPTGLGKSLIYTAIPLMKDEMMPNTSPHIALVVSPLRALIFDQVTRCLEAGINAVALTTQHEMSAEAMQSLKTGALTVILTSPEAIEQGPWLTCLKRHRQQVCVLAFDELHCLSEWGADFRPAYLNAVTLRSVFTHVPLVGLSATVNRKVLADCQMALKLKDNQLSILSALPDRPSIYLEVVHQRSFDYEEDLLWIATALRDQQQQYPKTLVYAQTIQQVVDIYQFFMLILREKAYQDKQHVPTSRVISMYHGQIGTDLQAFVRTTFKNIDSVIRVLVCTIAFGLGIDIPDVRQVIHWGKSKSLLCHWQEVGRCGRDQRPAKAIWYPKSTAGDDKEIFDKLKHDESVCVRKTILEHFILPGMAQTSLHHFSSRSTLEMTACCNHCKKKCEDSA